ncbi:MAG: hypothetical protein U0821_21370 [Chloroflexota bacterium]
MRHRLLALVLALVVVAAAIPSGATAEDGARIDSPVAGARVSGRVEIVGRATADDPSGFDFYRLHYGPGEDPGSLRPIGGVGDRAVEHGRLGVWDTGVITPGVYTVQLTVYDRAGHLTVARVTVNVVPAPTPTLLTNLPGIALPAPTSPPGEVPEATPIVEIDTSAPPPPVVEIPQPVVPAPAPLPLPPAPIAPIGQPPAPVQVEPIRPAPPIVGVPAGPSGSEPIVIATPSFEQPAAPPAPVIQAPAAPPAPIIPTYEPPPTLPVPPPPTPFGLPQ